MAGERAFPGLGLRGFYTEGSDGWGVPLSEDLRKLSALTQLVAESVSAMLPGDADGTVRLDPADGAIVVRDAGETIRIAAREGMSAYVKSTGKQMRYLPGSGGWSEITEGGGGVVEDMGRVDRALTLAQLVVSSRFMPEIDIEAAPEGAAFISRTDDPAYPGWISVKRDGYTSRYEPEDGWLAYVQDEGVQVRYSLAEDSWKFISTGGGGGGVDPAEIEALRVGLRRALALSQIVAESGSTDYAAASLAITDGQVYVIPDVDPDYPNAVLARNGGVTDIIPAADGWLAYVKDTDAEVRYSAVEAAWISTAGIAPDPVVLYRAEPDQAVRPLTQADFDGSAVLEITDATDSAVVIPAGLTASKPLVIVQGGAGRISVTAATGVTLQYALAATTRAQHSVLTILPIASDRYVVAGDVE